MSNSLQAAAAVVITLGTGTAAVTTMNKDVPDFAMPKGPWQAGGALDGRVFNTRLTNEESGNAVNKLTFADGRFQSARCQTYCDFGWSEYQTWTEGGVIRFTATTPCPDAPHTVVWYGAVTGDDVRLAGTWTTRRWYWTQRINLAGEGRSATPVGEAVSG